MTTIMVSLGACAVFVVWASAFLSRRERRRFRLGYGAHVEEQAARRRRQERALTRASRRMPGFSGVIRTGDPCGSDRVRRP